MGNSLQFRKGKVNGAFDLKRPFSPVGSISRIAPAIVFLIIFSPGEVFSQTTSNCFAKWDYRRKIQVDNTNGPALSNYNLRLAVNTSNLIGQGKMQNEGSDLRFSTFGDCCDSLDYWVESGMNSSNTIIWVRIPQIRSGRRENIYMFYGNSKAVSTETSPDSLFLFYDDFSGTSLDTSKWDTKEMVNARVKVQNSAVRLIDKTETWNFIHSRDTFGYNTIYESRTRVSTNNTYRLWWGLVNQDLSVTGPTRDTLVRFNDALVFFHHTSYPTSFLMAPLANGSGGSGPVIYSNADTNFYNFKFERYKRKVYAYIDNTLQDSMGSSGRVPTRDLSVYYVIRSKYWIESDWVRIRNMPVYEPPYKLSTETKQDVRLTSSLGDSLCAGYKEVVFKASRGFLQYKFFVNSVKKQGGGKIDYKTSTIKDGDVVQVKAGSGNCAVLSGKLNMNVFSKPNVGITPDTLLCYGDSLKLNVSGGTTYHWDSSRTLSCLNCTGPVAKPEKTEKYRVTVESQEGCIAHDSVELKVYPGLKPKFKTASVCFGQKAQFQNQTSGKVASTYWDFGDGNSTQSTNATHLYNDTGNFPVLMEVYDTNGCVYTRDTNIRIKPLPTAGFSVNPVCEGQNAKFRDASSIPDQKITEWKWYFGDGDTSSMSDPQHAYDTSGMIPVMLVVKGENNCLDTTVKKAEIFPRPKVDFSFMKPCLGDTMIFTDQTSLQNGSILSHTWEFGDGDFSSLKNPNHYYTKDTIYEVKLTVESQNRCKGKRIKKVEIRKRPVAKFKFDGNCEGKPVQFTDQSKPVSGKLSFWAWSFGDNTSSQKQNPSHTYDSVGSYFIFLSVANDFGCFDTAIKKITIDPLPEASFGLIDMGATKKFVNSSSRANRYKWLFDDGSTSNEEDPQHTFDTKGEYKVKLIAFNDCGSDTFVRSVFRTGLSNNTFPGRLEVYPNPAKDKLFIEFRELDARKLTLRLMDKTGKTVIKNQWELNTGAGKRSLSLKDLPSGMYHLQLLTSKGSKFLGIIKRE